MTIKRPPDHDARQKIVTDLDTNMLVEAAAGTGKTTSIIGRMLALIAHGKCTIEKLVAVTFTRKAAAELRARFQMALEKAAREATADGKRQQESARLATALEHIDRAVITTIHSFCERLLRDRPIEAGVDPAFEGIDEVEDAQLRSDAWDEYVAGLHVHDDATLGTLRELGLPLDELKPSFLQMAKYPDVDNWPAEDVDLGDVQGACAELRKYVGEMEKIKEKFPPDGERGTDKLMERYERVCRMARQRDLNRPRELMEVLELFRPKQTAVQKFWKEFKEDPKEHEARWDDFTANVAEPLLVRWRAKRYALAIRLLRDAMDGYRRLRMTSAKLNFQDLLIEAANLLRRWPHVRSYFRRRFTHLLVDEFQDTDPIQAEVLLLLTADDPSETDWRKCRPVAGSLCVVGDPKQSIYRFRRADITTYNQVRQIIEDTGGVIVNLTANFRSTPDIIDWVNPVFDGKFPQEATAYAPAKRAMEAGYDGDDKGDLKGIHLLTIPDVESGNKETSVAYDSARIARYIARAVREGRTLPRTRKEMERGVAATAETGDFLIVTYGKKQLAHYAARLAELGVPHEVVGGSGLGEVSEVGLLADCLRAVTEPEDPVALVRVLRCELFGLSDVELYLFKNAGGRFQYHSRIPTELADETGRRFADAFERLKRYDDWLKRLPPVAAVERIAADLGLTARAASRPGGNVLAGSIAKAIEMLRSRHADSHSPADLASDLVSLIEQSTEFSGIPAQSHDKPPVRLMNLHKVKGLEAPVVFLADPTGDADRGADLHIDRTGGQTSGAMAIYGKQFGFQAPLLACPLDWEAQEEEEKKFLAAEKDRLYYVAATRAAAQLVVTQKAKDSRSSNYWRYFADSLAGRPELADAPEPPAVADGPELTPEAIDAAVARTADNWRQVGQKSYDRAAAKEISVSHGVRPHFPNSGEHGAEWGSAVHAVLEAAMRQPGADLDHFARAALEQQGLAPTLAGELLATVRSVMKSDLWRRAMAAGSPLVEVPFTECIDRGADGGVPTVVRGAIDLAFVEGGGWVIADYKTDAVDEAGLPQLVAHYRGQLQTYSQAWQRMTGQSVREAGLYFVRLERYVTVRLDANAS